MRLHQAGQSAEAYELLTSEGEKFTDPGEDNMILYLRSCTTARAGNPEQAVAVIQQAFDKGYWYSEMIMRESPSYATLQGRPEFEQLVELARTRQAEASEEPQLLVVEPEGDRPSEQPYPTLVVLHGNGQTGRVALTAWRPATEQGWLVASIQSSQPSSYNMYVWDNQETAIRDVESQFAQLREQYNLDTNRLILAGFSYGGETALRATLTGTVPSTGFVLLGPGGDGFFRPEEWRSMIEQAKGKGLRGYVLLGEQDSDELRESATTMVRLLNEGGIPCELEMLADLGHAYPQDFGPIIQRALAFVEQDTTEG
jgi:predicted esterase